MTSNEFAGALRRLVGEAENAGLHLRAIVEAVECAAAIRECEAE